MFNGVCGHSKGHGGIPKGTHALKGHMNSTLYCSHMLDIVTQRGT